MENHDRVLIEDMRYIKKMETYTYHEEETDEISTAHNEEESLENLIHYRF